MFHFVGYVNTRNGHTRQLSRHFDTLQAKQNIACHNTAKYDGVSIDSEQPNIFNN